MASTVRISDLKNHIGSEVTLRGWVYNLRSSGKVAFLIVRDGTGLCQCVMSKADLGEETYREATHIEREASVEVTGPVRADDRAIGGVELDVSAIRQVSPSPEFPITPKPHGVDFLMKHRHLWLRSNRQAAILRIRHTLINAIRDYFNTHGFFLVDTPLLAPSAGEGTSTLFSVDYFGEPVYLAQTGQLYLEAACMALGKVYCFGPTFRAEKSKTRRHLTEFWMVEPEVAFTDIDELMTLAEGMICHLVDAVLTERADDFEILGRDLAPLRKITPPFPRL